jgi:hypothetical protein
VIIAYLILAVGFGLGLLLWTLYRRGSPVPELFADPDSNLLPPIEVVHALFDSRDRDFVRELGSSELTRMLETKRRELALLWISAVRREAVRALQSHRLSSSRMPDLTFAGEVHTFYQMTSFLMLYCVVALFVRVASVFQTRRLLTALFDLSRSLLDSTAAPAGLQAAAGTGIVE